MSAKPCCVLVDDDRDFLSFMVQLLSKVCPDLEVAQFPDAFSALEFFERKKVDLVITDFQMPVFDGLQLTAAIRSRDAAVPVVVMSGREIGHDAAKSGASAFLPKTTLLAELGPTLERMGIQTVRSGLGWMSARPAD
jgi:DNA-binding NtrC family response regulator